MKPVIHIKMVYMLFIILVLITSACSAPSAQPGASNPLPVPIIPTQPNKDNAAAAASEPPAAEPPAVEPTAVATLADPVPLELVDQGFAVAPNDTVHYGFLVRNPNLSHALQSSTFTATFYNAAGTVLGTDDLGAIELVLPGQTLGVGDGLWLDDPAVASMSIALTSGEPVVMTEALPPYEVAKGSICNIPLGMGVRTEITNPYAVNVLLPRISVIYYDAAGKIIGAGSGYRSGFPASSKAGALIWGHYGEGMDHYEVYPGYRGIPALTSSMPSDAQPLRVTASGYVRDGLTLTYGVVVENPNTAYLVDQSLLAVSAYDAGGKFITGDTLALISLPPGQKLGISQSLDLCDGDAVDHIEVAIGSGEINVAGQTAYFDSENVALQNGAVSGDLVNRSGMEIKLFYATAIVYDANDQIIGGGSQTIEGIAADGRITVQVPVVINGTPARAELYGVLTRKSLQQ